MPTVKISALTELAANPALDDLMPFVDISDTTQALTGTTKYIKISPFIARMLQMPGRLSLSNTLAVPTSDLTAQTTLYYVLTGDKGDLLPLYSSSTWKAFTISSPLSLSLAGLTASSVYDIFAYDNSGTPTLEALIWSSSGAGTSARATALTTQNGRYVKNGDATRLYLGSILIDAAGGAASDSLGIRGVWNLYNQVERRGYTFNSTNSWTYSTGPGVREANAGTGQSRFLFVCGLTVPRVRHVWSHAFSNAGAGTNATVGLSIDSTSAINLQATNKNATGVIVYDKLQDVMVSTHAAGYHYITITEDASAGATLTHYGATYTIRQHIILDM